MAVKSWKQPGCSLQGRWCPRLGTDASVHNSSEPTLTLTDRGRATGADSRGKSDEGGPRGISVGLHCACGVVKGLEL